MNPMIKDVRSSGPLSPHLLLRALPVVLIIGVVLAIGYMVVRQLGYDSATVTVADVKTGEETSYRIVSILPRDAIPAITDPKFVSSTEAQAWMTPSEQVIGLEIEGETKAYPINMLSRHEIVDDVVGGKPVAVTW